MHKRAVQLTILVLAAIGLTFLFSACGGSTPSATSASEWITAAEGGTVSIDGVATIEIPPGSLSGDTPVTIIKATNGGTVPTELDGADAVGQAFSIDVGGQSLSGPITLEIPFDASALPDGVARELVFLAFYDAEKGEWIPAGGQVDTERDVIIIETDHLSWWNPFTWNWDAWTAVLKKTLSLKLSNWVEGFELLTEECVESGDNVTVDNSGGNSVIKGCVAENDSSSPELRVINLKAFHIVVDLPDTSDLNMEPAYPLHSIFEPGEAVRFPTPRGSGEALALASFSDEAMRTFVVSLVLRMLPGGDLVPNEGLAFIADGLAKVITADEIRQDLASGDSLSAAEGVFDLITGDSFIETFAKLATKYGQENGIDMMTKWTQAGIQKTLLAVAAVDVIISTTDFLANYIFNHESRVIFKWSMPAPSGVPGPGSSPTAGDTDTSGALPVDDGTPEGLARRAIAAMKVEDWGAFLELVRPDERDGKQRRIDEGVFEDVSGCDLGAELYLTEEVYGGRTNVIVVFDTECVGYYYNNWPGVVNKLTVSLSKLSGQWWVNYVVP